MVNIKRILLKCPILLQFVDPIHQTAELADALTREFPLVIEYVREDLRTPELIAACIAADPLCANVLTPIPTESTSPTDELMPPKLELLEDGFSAGFTWKTWQEFVLRSELKSLRKVLKKTPSFSTFLTQMALEQLATITDTS